MVITGPGRNGYVQRCHAEQALAFCPTVPHNAPAQMGELMFDTATARRMMVDGQVRTADVTDLDLQEAMLTLPREHFLPQSLAPLAYLDKDIPLGNGRALLKPMVLAKLIQAAEVRRGDRVLDVGCGDWIFRGRAGAACRFGDRIGGRRGPSAASETSACSDRRG